MRRTKGTARPAFAAKRIDVRLGGQIVARLEQERRRRHEATGLHSSMNGLIIEYLDQALPLLLPNPNLPGSITFKPPDPKNPRFRAQPIALGDDYLP